MSEPRILIVAEHASAQFGGEAILPLHYFRVLRRRGIEAWMVVHERTREELVALFPEDRDRLHFVPDTFAHRLLWRASEPFPDRLAELSFGFAMRSMTQLQARSLVKRLCRKHRVSVVHQPIPVSPKEPSLMFGLGAPVVMGPMNGGMAYPDAFRAMDSPITRNIVSTGRVASRAVNRAIRGKYEATTLIGANARTCEALPKTRGRVVELVENGVDLTLWAPPESQGSTTGAHFVFLGRLVDWKAVDIVVEALVQVPEATLEIIGDGYMRPSLEAQVEELGLGSRVQFCGWLPQREAAARLQGADALVLPSLFECGGAVVLEAMATGLPCLATAWGGPADYLDDSCGILVPPTSREGMVQGFAEGMRRLADSPELRATMGDRARKRVVEEFDWERKVDRMLSIYQDAAERWR